MDETKRKHLGELLDGVKGDPKTSAALVAYLGALQAAVLGKCEDCASTQGAALENVPGPLTAEEANAIGEASGVAAAAGNAVAGGGMAGAQNIVQSPSAWGAL